MADDDTAAHVQRLHPIQDQVERKRAQVAGLMQVDIEGFAMLVRQAEQHVERLCRVAVDGAGIQPAQHIRALRQGQVQQRGRAWPPQQP